MCLCDVFETPRPTDIATDDISLFLLLEGVRVGIALIDPRRRGVFIWSCRTSPEVKITCVNHLPLMATPDRE